ncbi:MAG TPA: hypothetical protein VNV62_24175 [Trebonia sp.]|nr:hypothetical protein [Trebonia sp.]
MPRSSSTSLITRATSARSARQARPAAMVAVAARRTRSSNCSTAVFTEINVLLVIIPTYSCSRRSGRLFDSADSTHRSCPVRTLSTAHNAASTAACRRIPVLAAICRSASAPAVDNSHPASATPSSPGSPCSPGSPGSPGSPCSRGSPGSPGSPRGRANISCGMVRSRARQSRSAVAARRSPAGDRSAIAWSSG